MAADAEAAVPGADRLQRAVAILSGDDDSDRICAAIPDSACRPAPRNYLLNLANGAASKLAEQLAGPRLVLPWLLGGAGAPALLVGALMPVKQAGSLLPQLLVSGAIRVAARRKWYWVGAGVVQAACLLLMLAALLTLPAGLWPWCVLALLAVFSLASGVASVAFQDVLAKTVGKGVRGSLLANRTLVGGLLALAAGATLSLPDGPPPAAPSAALSAALLGGGALLWLLAAVAFAATQEAPGATEGGRNPVEESRAGLQLLRREKAYRDYLLVRMLLLAIEVAAPLFVLASRQGAGGAVVALGAMVAAMALAEVLSSRLWGGMADRGARDVLWRAGLLGALAAAVLLVVVSLPWAPGWLLALPFLLLGVAEAGVRLGRKTWLVDAASDAVRPTAVAFSNTATGVLALPLTLLAAAAAVDGRLPVLLVLLLATAGALWARRLPAEARIGAAARMHNPSTDRH